MLKLTSLMITLAALPTLAEASALTHPLNVVMQSQLKNVTSRAPQRSLVTAADQTCADFSGQWAGTCQVAGKEQKASFLLTQNGCTSISLDGDKTEMGHNKLEADNSSFGNLSAQVASRFSADGQTAKAAGTVFIDSALLPDSVTGTFGGELSKAGEDLHVNGKMLVMLGMKDAANVPVECSFRKSN